MSRVYVVSLICMAAGIRFAVGQGTIILDSPRDDREARANVAGHDALEGPRKAYNALIKEISAFRRAEIIRMFGRPLSSRPDSAVRPIFGPRAYVVPGIMIHASTGFFALGETSFVDVQFSDEQVVAAILYFRADDSFVPLRSTEDFESRLRWDLRKLEQVRHWWNEQSPSAPTPAHH